MNALRTLHCNPINAKECSSKLENYLLHGSWVELLPPRAQQVLIPESLLPKGPGVILSSGGTAGGPQQCLQPCLHLNQSAQATGQWLQAQGIEPQNCIVLNPLPIHHVSGLMPWWRSRFWGAEHKWLMPSLMHNPIELDQACKVVFEQDKKPVLISLVPTQLRRLLNNHEGIRFLQRFSIIWVGGAAIAEDLKTTSRAKKLNLAPCYGSTETAAMVTALSPREFLSGNNTCGAPLIDVQLRLDANGALEVKTPRLAIALCKEGALKGLSNKSGWWRSGDFAELISESSLLQLKVTGRVDNAIHSGGETVFPEQLEARLIKAISATKLPIEELIFLPIQDPEWGERIVALVRFRNQQETDPNSEAFIELQKLVANWQPAEKPVDWIHCPTLAPNSAGKWERARWTTWLKAKH